MVWSGTKHGDETRRQSASGEGRRSRRGCLESRNVIRLTDIKLKYPFWEFAASRVADLPRHVFSPRFLLFSISLSASTPPLSALVGPALDAGKIAFSP